MANSRIQVFCKQSVKFNHPKDYNVKHETKANEFTYIPDWVLDSTMFKLLQQKNMIKVIGSKQDVVDIETSNGKVIDKALEEAEEAATSTVEAAVDYETLKAKELYSLCIEKGVEVQEKQPKDYYIEKLTSN